MGLPSSARRPVDGAIVGVNRLSSLSSGLVFAWSADMPSTDIVTGAKGARTNVQSGQGSPLGTACNFNGGAEGASDINFGNLVETASLHMGPVTWAFIASVTSGFNVNGAAAYCCHSDANNDRGFNLLSDSNGWIHLDIIRPSNGFWGTADQQPALGELFAVVVTFDGVALTTGVHAYKNGIPLVSNGSGDSTGSTGAATAENLYLGRSRGTINSSHNGLMAMQLMANRVWTDREIQDWSGNPWGWAKTATRRIIVAAASGTSGTLAAAGTGTAALAGTSTVTGTLAPAGTGQAALSGTSTVTGSLAAAGTGQAALSGSETLTGTLAAAGDGQAALSGSPELTGSLAASGSGTAALSGTSTEVGTLAAAGDGVAALSGTSTITGTLGPSGGGGQASILGAQPAEGDLVVAGDGAAALSGTSTVTGALADAGDGQAALAGTSTVTGALATASGGGQAALQGTPGEIGALAVAGGGGTAALSGSPVVSGSLSPSGSGSAAMTGTSSEVGTLAPSGTGVAALAGTSTITGSLAAAGAGGRAAIQQAASTTPVEDEWHPDGNLGSAIWRPDFYAEPPL
jgi:hypothetical protein